MKLKSWQEQIASDQAFRLRAVPFALAFLLGLAEARFHFDLSWSSAFAAGLGLGLLAAVATVNWAAGGWITFVTLFRLLVIALQRSLR